MGIEFRNMAHLHCHKGTSEGLRFLTLACVTCRRVRVNVGTWNEHHQN